MREKYCITRKELAAIIFGLKQYRQYLLGRQFVVRSDHAALTYLHSANELIGQQAKWLDFMEEFSFTLQHRAAIIHGNADALSRKHSLAELKNIALCCLCHKRGMVTCAQKRRLPDPVPGPPDMGNASDADSDVDTEVKEPPPVLSKRHRRRRQRDTDVQQSLDPWTPTFLAERQAEDENLRQVQNWLRTKTVPEWDDL